MPHYSKGFARDPGWLPDRFRSREVISPPMPSVLGMIDASTPMDMVNLGECPAISMGCQVGTGGAALGRGVRSGVARDTGLAGRPSRGPVH